MKISELISKLEKIKETNGDVICVIRQPHDYFGYVDKELESCDITFSTSIVTDNNQPDTKSGVIF